MNYLKNDNMLDFYDLKFDALKEHRKLYTHVEEKYKEDKENILLIDEVQQCNRFELAINSFRNSGKLDIYKTAFLISTDLATLFTGRYIELHVFHSALKNTANTMAFKEQRRLLLIGTS